MSTLKQALIDTNNAVVYIILALLFITVSIMVSMGQILPAAVVLGIGWVVTALIWGFWLVASSILDTLQAQNVLVQQQNVLLFKLYKEVEANNVNNQ